VEILQRLSPAYWWTDPTSTIEGPLVQAFAIILGTVFVLAVMAWVLAPRLAPGHRLHQRLIARAAKWALALAAIGLLLLLLRWQLVPFFSKRLWMILWFAAVVASLAYAVSFRRRRYPELLAEWEASERRRRYLPKPGHGAARSRRRSRRRR
jgi:hypothetical protein